MEINLSPRLASFLGETEEGFQNMTPANNPSNPNYLNSSTLNNSSNDIHPDFHYNKHNESVFDDERLFPCLQSNGVGGELYKFDENNPELLNHATLKALIVQRKHGRSSIGRVGMDGHFSIGLGQFFRTSDIFVKWDVVGEDVASFSDDFKIEVNFPKVIYGI